MIKRNSVYKVQCLVSREGSVKDCTPFLFMIKYNEGTKPGFRLIWFGRFMPRETLCKDLLCWLLFERKMKSDMVTCVTEKLILIRVKYQPILFLGPVYPAFVITWYYCFLLPDRLGRDWSETLVLWVLGVKICLSFGRVFDVLELQVKYQNGELSNTL